MVKNSSRGKSRNRDRKDIDLDMQEDDKFGVLSANRQVEKRVSKMIAKKASKHQ